MSTTFRNAGTLLSNKKEMEKLHTQTWMYSVFTHTYISKACGRCRSSCNILPEGLVEGAEVVIAFVRDGYSALVGVDGAEGKILCCGLALGQHIEEC
jgi:hypothetical protein